LPTSFDLDGPRCLVVAEVAQAHDGSLGTAHAYIDAAARAGADAVKFQTHIAAAESSPDEPWRVKFSPQDVTRYEYWKRMEFTADQWHGLAAHARESGLAFLSSPFSLEAVDLLESVGVPAWKVAAGELTNRPLVERMARTGKPLIFSTGLSDWQDLDRAVETARKWNAPFLILQCTTAYPCPPEKLGLNVMAEIRQRYGCAAGLSDHSGTIYAGLAAAALGAKLVEVHVTFSRECFGPDVSASLTTLELKTLVEGIRFIERAAANPVEKDAAAEALRGLRSTFGKSLVAVRTLPAGHQVQEPDLAAKKPGIGIAVSRIGEFTNRRLKRAVAANQRFSEDDFE
jgi:N,N'-diacetyllegionaminate synthase